MKLLTLGVFGSLVLGLGFACSSDESPRGSQLATGGSAGAGGNSGATGSSGALGASGNAGDAGSGGNAGSISFDSSADSGGSAGSDAGQEDACASAQAKTTLEPVHLAFAFDVSGSMGQGDEPWHDRTLKWDPISAATKAFFADPASRGFYASLTFFPEIGAESVRCTDAVYVDPDVAPTALPSTAFATALDVIPTQAWRPGTPTVYVLRGVFSFVDQEMAGRPGRYVVVLVTDGYPSGCSNNRIADVVNVVSQRAMTIPTYVIGVNNPPISGAPDTTSNLNQVAVAGGTTQAFLIDTGNPTATTAAFKTAIEQIRRGVAISCNLAIPMAPDNRKFDKEKVRVNYASGTNPATALTYDPMCTGMNGWRYDDPANPTQIVLCTDACTTIQADPNASLSIDFECERVISVPQ
jgi:hypothetical protein